MPASGGYRPEKPWKKGDSMWNALSHFLLISYYSFIFSLAVLCSVLYFRTRDKTIFRILLLLYPLFFHGFFSLIYHSFRVDLSTTMEGVHTGLILFFLLLTCIAVSCILFVASTYISHLIAPGEKERKLARRIISAYSILFFLLSLYFIIFLNGADWRTGFSRALNELFLFGSMMLQIPVITAAVFIKKIEDKEKRELLKGIIISFMPIGPLALLDVLFFINAPSKLVFISYFTFALLGYFYIGRYYIHRYEPERGSIPVLNSQTFKQFDISVREQELIPLLIDGKSNKEISEILFISPNTVKTHIQNIYRKMKVSNRLQLLSKTRNHPER